MSSCPEATPRYVVSEIENGHLRNANWAIQDVLRRCSEVAQPNAAQILEKFMAEMRTIVAADLKAHVKLSNHGYFPEPKIVYQTQNGNVVTDDKGNKQIGHWEFPPLHTSPYLF